ncbi:MAG: transglycosylase SLT domain-containing protein [Candidatus Gastranaerophilales bacterium]|nr:transglycosylase SLT domain-containing protein [Candidatus Gastranaerophilales bacterium]
MGVSKASLENNQFHYEKKDRKTRSKEQCEKLKKRAEEAGKKERDRIEREASASCSAYNAITAEQEGMFYRWLKEQVYLINGISKEDRDAFNAKQKAIKRGEYTEENDTTGTDTAGYNNGDLYVKNNNEAKYQSYILKYAKQYNLDPNLVAAVIEKESNWNPNAVSSANCKGLMQVNPKYVSGNLHDVDHNIAEGCRILRECMDAYPDSLEQALVAYNAGITGAKNTPSSSYSTKVMNAYNSRTELLAQNSANSTNKLDYSA